MQLYSVAQHDIRGTTSGHENHKKIKDLISRNKAIQENLLTSSSVAKEVSASIDLLQESTVHC
jgi:hypothetical protein